MTALVAVSALLLLAAYHVIHLASGDVVRAAVLISFSAVAWGVVASWLHKDHPADDAPGKRVGVVVPCYNEDPAAVLRCLDSLAALSRPPDVIWFIDDCSADPTAWEAAAAWSAAHRHLSAKCVRLDQNVGKRHAQAVAFRGDPEVDFWVTVDSDTVLDPGAISAVLAPFGDPRVGAVAGRLHGWNADANLLTRVVDVEFSGASVSGRAAFSTLGSVLVTCGAFAAYRASIIRENLDDYLTEKFGGRPVTAGDDRRLTQYALLPLPDGSLGRAAYADAAVGWTLLPTNLSHLVRQRLRWSASWYRGTWWCFRHLPLRHPAFWLAFWQAVAFAVFTAMFPFIVIAPPDMLPQALGAYVALMAGLSVIRALRLTGSARSDQRVRRVIASVALAPLTSILYLLVLNPVRWWSVTKVFDKGWRTRSAVEVSAPGRDLQ